MKLLRSEKGIGLVDSGAVNEIIRELNEQYGQCKLREATSIGYVSRTSGQNYLAIYAGRFGVGITVRRPLHYTTRYCAKATYIWPNAHTHLIYQIIEEVIKRYGR